MAAGGHQAVRFRCTLLPRLRCDSYEAESGSRSGRRTAAAALVRQAVRGNDAVRDAQLRGAGRAHQRRAVRRGRPGGRRVSGSWARSRAFSWLLCRRGGKAGDRSGAQPSDASDGRECGRALRPRLAPGCGLCRGAAFGGQLGGCGGGHDADVFRLRHGRLRPRDPPRASPRWTICIRGACGGAALDHTARNADAIRPAAAGDRTWVSLDERPHRRHRAGRLQQGGCHSLFAWPAQHRRRACHAFLRRGWMAAGGGPPAASLFTVAPFGRNCGKGRLSVPDKGKS
mmetsp:Transcript_33588/g.60078  ORF Transcript_33588/g.60078 Transcript_33588/m.60078 type:complete len:285 (-) Transcript_33588:217-1071(-)